ncbi:SDR family NAD(P)-dependent oxidoreductase [Spiroplasma taiwanense]|uniref:Short-chain dehydrogenase/reductase SDR n=1 Tax=Spiroplasma taiwanense CT-1 TaxID=1276220 RepID=S5LUS4_9MOLU|nr:SDR family NAD(P)-dependent oxidoreductase [Spiroplasma taiwanense]AGR41554.1 short-chain dehydrogenase/reductase SDR [Spiroplasma taiwanense CT-1]
MTKNKLAKNTFAIVTGASKGLGYEYCKYLLRMGYNIIAIARDTKSLEVLKKHYPELIIEAWNLDISNINNVNELYNKTEKFNVDLLINNAGFGVWGYFKQTDLEKELNMIDLNIKALHILTKLFVQKFENQNRGRVLNIGSIAAFSPAPVFSSYAASKAYVLNLGIAINTELKKTKSNVRVITISPGPLKTDFWNRSSNQKEAKYKNNSKFMNIESYAKKSLLKGLKTKTKDYIIIGNRNKIFKSFTKWAPKSMVLNGVYNYQRKRK